MLTEKLTISEIAKSLRQKDFSARELTDAILHKCEQVEDEVKAYITLTPEKARQQADSVDKRLAAGDDLPLLAGIPVAVKDNIAVRDIPCTSASRMLENFRPPYDAFVWSQLESQGAVLVGKTNMDEFGMGISTENSYFQTSHNPHDISRIPGGSSGGSAAAVAAGEAIYALGSDTGGSVRQPASHCGLVGLKPSYGRVSRRGVSAMASSFDQVGPMSRTVRDNMIILKAMSAWDKRDCSSRQETFNLSQDLLNNNLKNCNKALEGITISWPENLFEKDLSEEVADKLTAAIKLLETLGAKIKKVQIKHVDAALAAYYILTCAEAASNLSRFDGVHYGYRSDKVDSLEDLYFNSRSEAFGYEVKRRILLGNFALSEQNYDEYFDKAQRIRTLIIREFEDIFADSDLMFLPVSSTTAWKIGQAPEDPLELWHNDIFTTPISLAGLPALSVPCGKDKNSLPIGMQLAGPAFSEELLYKVACAYEDQHEPAFQLAEV